MILGELNSHEQQKKPPDSSSKFGISRTYNSRDV